MQAMADSDHLLSAVWPVNRTYLAGLIDFGLSDARIAACFSVDDVEVRLLRETYNLDAASADSIRQAKEEPFTASALDELSNGVQAAVTYVSAAIKCARCEEKASATTILLMEKSLTQLQRIGRAYQTLRMRLPAATE